MLGALVVAAPAVVAEGLVALLRVIDDGCSRGRAVEKAELLEALAVVVPELRHVDTGRSLDQKM